MTDQDHTESIACCTAVSGNDRHITITVPPVPVTTPRDEPRINNIVKPEGRCNSASMTLMSSSYANRKRKCTALQMAPNVGQVKVDFKVKDCVEVQFKIKVVNFVKVKVKIKFQVKVMNFG